MVNEFMLVENNDVCCGLKFQKQLLFHIVIK